MSIRNGLLRRHAALRRQRLLAGGDIGSAPGGEKRRWPRTGVTRLNLEYSDSRTVSSYSLRGVAPKTVTSSMPTPGRDDGISPPRGHVSERSDAFTSLIHKIERDLQDRKRKRESDRGGGRQQDTVVSAVASLPDRVVPKGPIRNDVPETDRRGHLPKKTNDVLPPKIIERVQKKRPAPFPTPRSSPTQLKGHGPKTPIKTSPRTIPHSAKFSDRDQFPPPLFPQKLRSKQIPDSGRKRHDHSHVSFSSSSHAMPPAPVPTAAVQAGNDDDPFGSIEDDAFVSLDLMALTDACGQNCPPSIKVSLKMGHKHEETKAAAVAAVPSMVLSTKENDSMLPSPQPYARTAAKNNGNDNNDEDSFPDVDLDEIDRQIANYQSQQPLTASELTIDMRIPTHNVVNTTVPEDSNSPCDYACYDRYVVVAVEENMSTYTKIVAIRPYDADDLSPSPSQSQPALSCPQPPNRCLHLCGEWFHTILRPGDSVHLTSLSGRWSTSSLPAVLRTDDADDLMLVVNPDLLLSPSNIVAAMSCPRSAVLRRRLGSSVLTSHYAAAGILRHDAVQLCAMRGDLSSIHLVADDVVAAKADMLIGAQLQGGDVRQEIVEMAPQLKRFEDAYLAGNGRMNGVNPAHGSISCEITGTYGVEESATSPELGLTGNVDLTLAVSLAPMPSDKTSLGQKSAVDTLMPLELKTGHTQQADAFHMGQLSLYVAMLRARHGSCRAAVNPRDRRALVSDPSQNGMAPGGILLYLNGKGMVANHVVPSNREIKTLIGLRNNIADLIHAAARPRGVAEGEANDNDDEHDDDSNAQALDVSPATPAYLPDIIDVHTCQRCFVRHECMLYRRAEEAAPSSRPPRPLSQKLGSFYKSSMGNLTDADVRYFNDWDRMLDLEGDGGWKNMLRRKQGGGISGLRWDMEYAAPTANNEETTVSNSKVLLRFELQEDIEAQLFEKGNEIVIGTEGEPARGKGWGGVHVARGRVDDSDGGSLFLLTSRVDAARLWNVVEAHRVRGGQNNISFWAEGYEFPLGTIATLRQNLVDLFLDREEEDDSKDGNVGARNVRLAIERRRRRRRRLRKFVVQLERPAFDLERTSSMFDGTHGNSIRVEGCDLDDLAMEFYSLNSDQQEAVKKVISAKDYALVQGLPGTGKSLLLTFLARLLVARGERVLITSYTHTAVDNLMLKLKEAGVGKDGRLLRIGYRGACHADIRDLLPPGPETDDGHESPAAVAVVNALRARVDHARIFGVSALTVVKSPLLVRQHFDVVIVDEAGQMNQLACAGVLMTADLFVLAGDHMQLPPLTISLAAEKAD
uniref:DNA replication ATP-dependent helicase/nuclease n=1 Tax=Corethron hystrix TaxID=216773 RepID=A0A7S1BTW1_9STRA